MSKFIQLHALTSYPASLLNRDDVGFAKRMPFGSAVRTRVSSQCMKRHWRLATGPHSLADASQDVSASVRSRHTFERFVYEPLVEDGIDSELARRATEEVMALVLGKSAKAKAKKGEEPTLQTGQLTVLGRPELDFVLGEARALCEAAPSDDKAWKEALKERFDREARKNIDALRCSMGLDAALFGRMVTSDHLARADAALHVAHAFTVHAEQAETDYFTAVDDLGEDGDEEAHGSAHIGTTELASGLYYIYVCIDLPLLVSNIEGCAQKDWAEADLTLTREVLRRFVHLLATISPGAKLGSTAPHAYAQCVVAESGDWQPRSLANAFLDPVPTRGNVLESAYAALNSHLSDLDGMYGAQTERAIAALGPVRALSGLPDLRTLPDVADWVAEKAAP